MGAKPEVASFPPSGKGASEHTMLAPDWQNQRQTEGRLPEVDPKTEDHIYYEPKPKPKITENRCPKIQLLL